MESFVLPEDAIHLGDVLQGEEAASYNGWAGRTILLVCEIGTEAGDPENDLRQRWRLQRSLRHAMYAAYGVPLDRLKWDFARQVAVEPGQQRRIQDAPVDHGKQPSGTREPVEIAKLPCSTRQPLLSTRCHDSIVQRRAYHVKGSNASSWVRVGTEVSNIHSRGSTPSATSSSSVRHPAVLYCAGRAAGETAPARIAASGLQGAQSCGPSPGSAIGS
ncbi:hypothetical protein LMG29542_07893 [Paraburkholderia humisilvae]|uniref:Uncharacterized protein n=1 Tax=Paraburkholderia humisilvae TaxID=627669 RepID=A0A6J5FBA6_9BURK|nr:hypothetical protein LMG29542_07893 [Paraburkholderia humisilvae]